MIEEDLMGELKDLAAWRDKGASDIDLLDYAGFVGTPDLLFAFAAVFAPPLTQHKGEHFLASHFDAETHAQWEETLPDAASIQRVMNHLHISTLFQAQDISPRMAVAAARTIAQLWNRQFRDLDLVAETSGDDLHSASVTLVRRPPGSRG